MASGHHGHIICLYAGRAVYCPKMATLQSTLKAALECLGLETGKEVHFAFPHSDLAILVEISTLAFKNVRDGAILYVCEGLTGPVYPHELAQQALQGQARRPGVATQQGRQRAALSLEPADVPYAYDDREGEEEYDQEEAILPVDDHAIPQAPTPAAVPRSATRPNGTTAAARNRQAAREEQETAAAVDAVFSTAGSARATRSSRRLRGRTDAAAAAATAAANTPRGGGGCAEDDIVTARASSRREKETVSAGDDTNKSNSTTFASQSQSSPSSASSSAPSASTSSTSRRADSKTSLSRTSTTNTAATSATVKREYDDDEENFNDTLDSSHEERNRQSATGDPYFKRRRHAY